MEQFAAVMGSFSVTVAFEMCEASIGSAIGVAHDQHTLGLVQSDRHTDLFEDEIPFEVVARRGQGFGSSGDDDHVHPFNFLLLQELSDGRSDAVIEAAEHGRVGHVGSGR